MGQASAVIRVGVGVVLLTLLTTPALAQNIAIENGPSVTFKVDGLGNITGFLIKNDGGKNYTLTFGEKGKETTVGVTAKTDEKPSNLKESLKDDGTTWSIGLRRE